MHSIKTRLVFLELFKRIENCAMKQLFTNGPNSM